VQPNRTPARATAESCACFLCYVCTECVQHQKVIADDVLGLSKLEHARVSLELQTFPLAETVQRALSMYEAIVKLKKLRLTLDYACTATHVKGDPNRLKQIIANILNNAVKVRTRCSTNSHSAGWQCARSHWFAFFFRAVHACHSCALLSFSSRSTVRSV
jgi:light-regulated signal transduction histidine kinase (bacteriophytochrome)